MAQNITISRTAGTRALLAALLAIVVLLVTRTVKNALTALKWSALCLNHTWEAPVSPIINNI